MEITPLYGPCGVLPLLTYNVQLIVEPVHRKECHTSQVCLFSCEHYNGFILSLQSSTQYFACGFGEKDPFVF